MTNKIKTAVILVGGAGLRMRPLTEGLPKCMIPLYGKPLIWWTLTWLKENDFEHVVLGVSYLKDIVIDFVKSKSFGMKVDFSEHTQKGETGEGFRLAIQRHVKDKNFLAMNGDELTNLNLERFINFHLQHKSVATVAVSRMRSPFAIIQVEEDYIVGFNEKPILEDKLVSAGIYIFSHSILDYLPTIGSIEKITFPRLAQDRLLTAYKLNKEEKWITINSIKDLSIAEEEFASLRRAQE